MKRTFQLAFLVAAFVWLGICPQRAAAQQNQNNFSGQGSGSGLPTASAAGQVPVSSGPGTTYNAAFLGIAERSSTCTSNVDAILPTDRGELVVETISGACAVSLSQAGTSGFTNNFYHRLCGGLGATITLTPTTSTLTVFTGSAVLTAQTSLSLTAGQCADIQSGDNINYSAEMLGGGGSSLPDLTDTAGVKVNSAVPFTFSVNNAVPAGSPVAMFRKSGSQMCWSLGFGDAADFCMNSVSGFSAFSSGIYGWTNSGSDASGTIDTGWVRCTAACISAASSVNPADTSGSIRGSVISTYDSETTTNVGSHMDWTRAACETAFGITTLSTGSATTTTGQNCLPANAVVDYVVYRITTTITTATSFTIGITGTTSKFCSTQSTLTSGTTGLCAAQTGTAGALDGTSAAPIVITSSATPGAGAMRLIVFYHIAVAPTS